MGPQLGNDARFRHLVWEGQRPPAAGARAPAGAAGMGQCVSRGKADVSLDKLATPDEAALICAVLAHAGLRAGDYRVGPMVRRLPACLRALGVKTAGAAVEALAARPGLRGRALDTLLNATTSLFRDQDVFEFLRSAVVPVLARRARPRVLSVGCSSGAELASVAMMLDEAGALASSELLGIDCRPSALTAARLGSFSARDVAGMSPRVRARHLSETPRGFELSPAVLDRLAFQLGDALAPLPAGPWDLILCRNVAIYLEEPAGRKLWRQLSQALAPAGGGAVSDAAGDGFSDAARSSQCALARGYLVVGHAERVPPECGLSRQGPCVYRRERK